MGAQDHDWCRRLEGSQADRVRGAVDRLDRANENGDITDEDHRLIHDLLEYEALVRKGGDGLSNNTLKNRAQCLQALSKRNDTPLTEHTAESIERMLADLKSGRHPDVKDSGIGVSNRQKALRVFYRRHDHLGVDPEDIDIDQDSGKDLRPEDLLYRDEVDAIFQQTRDLRDRAMFALMLATGQRKDAVRTLRMKHVEKEGRGMAIRLNDTEGATKGASGTVPLFWSKHYVRDWIDHHPYQDDPEAAVFPPAKGAVPEEDRRDFMTGGGSVSGVIRRMAERAGVKQEEKDRGVHPHLLRATAITRMAAKGVSEQQIKQVVGWSRDSSQFETYVALADDINNDRAREELGYATSGEETPTIGRPTLEECPECADPIPEGRDLCPNPGCGFDLSAPVEERPEPDTDGVAGPTISDPAKDAIAEGVAETFEELEPLVVETAAQAGADREEVERQVGGLLGDMVQQNIRESLDGLDTAADD